MKRLSLIRKLGDLMLDVNRGGKIILANWWMAGLIVFMIAVASCTPEDEVLTREEGVQLLFDQDTVQFDTVFTTVGSTTQWLQVYNPQTKAVNIGSVSLAAPENSPFRLRLNGEAGTQFRDVRLRGGDSLLLLVEVTVDPRDADLPFIVKDSIQFGTNGNVQYVNLEAWGQDANFLKSAVIARDTTFSGERPYVVCDSLRVGASATLTLAAGVQLFFSDRAYLSVGGTLRTEGTSDARVLLQHVRQDGSYENAPGQWQGVFFEPGSKDNALYFTTIRNASIGVSINSPDNDTIPDITLSNTVIEHMADYGLLALNADVDVYNTVISNCTAGLVAGLGRSYYRFRHCSLVNNDTRFLREDEQRALLFVQDFFEENPLTQPFSLQILNSIVWGSLDNELLIDAIKPGDQFKLLSTLIKTSDTTKVLADINLYNQQPRFVNAESYNYRLDSLSPAIDAGVPLGIERDLDGKVRDARPDLGAYEYSPE